MKNRTFRLFSMLFLLCLCMDSIVAREGTDPRPRAQAKYLPTAPIFDGSVEDDPAWQPLTPLTNFTQQNPNNGEPATLMTKVYVGYTDEALHIAFIAYEDDIDDMAPSSNGWESDAVMVVIDPYRSELSGTVFSTNQTGVEWDASLFNGNSDWNWSTVWDAKTKVNEDNWSVEMVIPFTSIQYPKQEVQSWGINFSRYVKNRNENSVWAPIPRQFSIWRLGLAGVIEDIKPPPSKRNIRFNPYLITAQGEGEDQELVDRSDYGFDVLYSLSPTLNLTATFNTDFAQVESDRLQINTGRFSLFFPETRPFFLENSALFSIGVPRETLVFHSRRIGIARDGTRLPMDGGVKLAGHVGRQNEVGLMYLRADSAIDESYEDFAVARYSRTLTNRSKFGFLATNRDSGSFQSQSFAGDLQWGIGEYGEIRSFFATSSANDGIDRDDEYTYAIYGVYNSPDWQSSASYHEVGAGFNPAMGFVQRRNSRKIHVASRRSVLIDSKWGLREWRPQGIYTAYWDFDGEKESGYLTLDSDFIWKNGANFSSAINLAEERVRYPFYVAGEEVLVGEYRSPELNIAVNGPFDRKWGISGALRVGGFYQGDRTAVNVFSSYTFSEHLNMSIGYNFSEVDFPNLEEPFDFSLMSFGFRAAFTPKLTFSGRLQYNDADDVLSTNVRFAWLRSASTGFYLVYSEVDDGRFADASQRRSVVLKYSHMFDVNF
ncbi:MAG: DUF5916 domain-containing protein [Gammaproteobacteria bacterium]|nr:DUF5916 domain-containing protein [Gammaproteobacteria bacterium]